jgi:beta-lactamase regulating signal transducer with metallopeptidase domain
VASGCLCLSWFNPLMYWAVGQFRFDQELACDASVLAATGTARRRYADALLKAQLAADSLEFVPAGCSWQSRRGLKKRIAVLKRPLPSYMRRAAGVLLAFACIGSGSYVAWATRAIAAMVPAWTCSKIPPILQGSAPAKHE